MNLRKLLLTQNECYRAGKTITPKGVMVHSTGAENPSLRRYVGPDDGVLGHNANGNHWNQFRPDNQQKCVHAFIGLLKDGTVATYQTLPWHWRGWHSGGSANNTHIGFEICEGALGDRAYFANVYREAVEFTAYLCKLYRLDPLADGVVVCHSEGARRGIASKHADVMHWFPRHGKNMDSFRQEVFEAMKGEDDMTEAQVKALINKTLAETDVAVAEVYGKTASWAKEAWDAAKVDGIFDGTRPGAPLTRQEAAVVLHRLGLLGVEK